MTENKKFTLLKIEGAFFALAMIFFTVMFYFEYISKAMLIVMLLMFTAFLFSINATIQEARTSKRMGRINLFFSVLFFLVSLGFMVYFYSVGLLTFGF
jgi:hypothetical protein